MMAEKVFIAFESYLFERNWGIDLRCKRVEISRVRRASTFQASQEPKIALPMPTREAKSQKFQPVLPEEPINITAEKKAVVALTNGHFATGRGGFAAEKTDDEHKGEINAYRCPDDKLLVGHKKSSLFLSL